MTIEHQNPTIRMYEIIKEKTDEQTAHDAISAFQAMVKAEVSPEIVNAVNEMDLKFGNRFNGVESRLNSMSTRINSMEIDMNNRFNSLELDMNNRFNSLESKTTERFNSLEHHTSDRFNSLERKIDEKNNMLRLEMVERIYASKNQTIIWIVSIGILQLVSRYLFR